MLVLQFTATRRRSQLRLGFDYHPTTIRLSFDYRPPCDYIRLPFDHHSSTIRLPSDYHSTTTRLPFDHHATAIRLPSDYHSTTSDYHPTTIRPPFDCSSTTSVKTNVSIFRCRSSNGRGRGWNYGRIAVESLLKFNVVISNSASKPWLLPGQLDRAEDIAVTAADGASKVRPAFSTCRAAAEAGARWRSRPTSWRGEPSSMCTTEPPCVCVPATSDLPAASPSTLPGHLRTHIYTWTDAER